MANDSVAAFLQSIRRSGLLSTAQLNDLKTRIALTFTDAQALAAKLVERHWLTEYQAEQLLEGHDDELVFGPYIALTLLGEGGLSRVLRAYHSQTQETVAIKVLHPELRGNQEVRAQFRQEMLALAQLDHPNFIKAYDIDPTGARHWFTMEIVEGIDLQKLVQSSGRLAVSQACDYIRQAAMGLQYAYEHGLVHRDVKPANLLVALKDHRLRILDIGLARREWDFSEAGTSTVTSSANSALMGTADYVAPEQALNPQEANIRADIYSLGCTLFHLITGQVPYPGRSLAKKLLDHQKSPVPSVRQHRPEVPQEVAVIVQKMMAKQAGDRYQTPVGVAVALRGYCVRDASWLSLEQVSSKPVERQAPRLGDTRPIPKLGGSGKIGFPATGGKDRRGSTRRAGNPVSILITDSRQNREPISGWVIDRCSDGLGLLVEEALEVGTFASLRPAAEQYSSRWMQVKIVYCHPERSSYRMGTQFVNKPSWGDMRMFG